MIDRRFSAIVLFGNLNIEPKYSVHLQQEVPRNSKLDIQIANEYGRRPS